MYIQIKCSEHKMKLQFFNRSILLFHYENCSSNEQGHLNCKNTTADWMGKIMTEYPIFKNNLNHYKISDMDWNKLRRKTPTNHKPYNQQKKSLCLLVLYLF